MELKTVCTGYKTVSKSKKQIQIRMLRSRHNITMELKSICTGLETVTKKQKQIQIHMCYTCTRTNLDKELKTVCIILYTI